MEMTYAIAHAASTDAGNCAMRKGGRTSWSEEDYHHAWKIFDSLIPLMPIEDRLRLTGNVDGIVRDEG
jgi:hypothetical protein